MPLKATEWAIYYEWEDKNCSGAGVIREAALSPCIAVRKAMKRLSKIYYLSCCSIMFCKSKNLDFVEVYEEKKIYGLPESTAQTALLMGQLPTGCTKATCTKSLSKNGTREEPNRCQT